MPSPGTFRPFDCVVSAALLLASGLGALLLGQDCNIDLYRYRLYVGYAFLHHRLDYDLAPAALSTYLPPFLEVIHYLGTVHLSPRVFAFLLGVLQGTNAVLIFLTARRLLPGAASSGWLALLAGVLAATGPTARSLLGTTLGDTIASAPMLLALFLVLGPRRGVAGLFGAGALGGVSVALKLTMAPQLCGLVAAVAMGASTSASRLKATFACLGGSILGWGCVAGYWSWLLWERFGNPLFPFANNVFRSPFVQAQAIRDTRWMAASAGDYLLPPLQAALGSTDRLQEIPFRDARFLLVLLAGLAWLWLRTARSRPPLPAGQRGVLHFVLAGYAAWAAALYYYRYAATLEFLAPLALVILVNAAVPRRALGTFGVATALLLLTSSVGSWGRQPWGEERFNVRLPPQAYEPDSLVLVDSSLSSFLIPFFPGETRFAGLEGTGSERLEMLLAARVAAHRGNLFWLASRGQPAPSSGPERLGVTATDDCGLIRTGEGRWVLCRVARPIGPRG
jgi:hypothetical protein